MTKEEKLKQSILKAAELINQVCDAPGESQAHWTDMKRWLNSPTVVEVTGVRHETIQEFQDRMRAAGHPYVGLSLPELWDLEASGDEEAVKELKRRDDAYSQLGQG